MVLSEDNATITNLWLQLLPVALIFAEFDLIEVLFIA